MKKYFLFSSIIIIAILIGVLLFSFLFPSVFARSTLLFENSNFEYGNLTNWTEEGGKAFQRQPTFGDNPIMRARQLGSNLEGSYWIGTFENRNKPSVRAGRVQTDGPVGQLRSIPFTIKKNNITFLVGGGNGTRDVGVMLLVDDRETLFEKPDGKGYDRETMTRRTWDVSKWKGKKGQIVIMDNSSGSWGHINADDFRAK